MKKRRVGIFGGTFNPPHNGHVASAEHFAEQMKLDKLLIMPAFIPPHKSYLSTVTCEERLKMCQIAFSHIGVAEISDLEIKRGGTSYTYLTLEELSDDETELFFLCGTDMILTMSAWKNPDIIFNLANICYMRREDDIENTHLIDERCREYTERYGARIYEINGEAIEISSSEIRAFGDNVQKYVPSGVLKYIAEKGLYK